MKKKYSYKKNSQGYEWFDESQNKVLETDEIYQFVKFIDHKKKQLILTPVECSLLAFHYVSLQASLMEEQLQYYAVNFYKCSLAEAKAKNKFQMDLSMDIIKDFIPDLIKEDHGWMMLSIDESLSDVMTVAEKVTIVSLDKN